MTLRSSSCFLMMITYDDNNDNDKEVDDDNDYDDDCDCVEGDDGVWRL